ncbi:HD-GYP domain-containing protein [Cytobacillus sp. NCCP-133]|uniref:HD-GYP domain-containing protein n=1 Tax=Cytobacillus sp. NCCP-133 TaxID=766848 RepID=UPI00222F826B|nr:HD-GYP domain-containing protein [Cytobacillus sp. NCCP-133]GLB59712.1 phosphodiesterase [Cytobacillus sp. NCCP-133]
MRLAATETVEAGSILAKAIYNDKGQVLLREGVKLAEKMIGRLQGMGISYIYIRDCRTEDIQYKDPLPAKMRKEAIQTIESVFRQVEEDQNLTGSLVIEKASKRFSEIIRQLIGEVRGNKELLTILSNVYTYDHYIFTHSLNVTLYSLAIGMKIKMPPKELETLGLGAILHDVGKIKVPADILMKPGRLTAEEFEEIKKHPGDGFELLKGVQTIPLIVAHCAFQHHERINGSGYPRGLQGEQIHDYGKIIAVADVFDAVTSNRIYRQAMLPHEGLEILYAGAGTLFEAKLIEAFRQAVAIYPVGITIELNDGRKGVVCRQNAGLSDRPVIRILEDNGSVTNPYEVDLRTELNTVITGCDTTFVKQ